MITAPPLEKAQKMLNGGPEDEHGNQSFKIGRGHPGALREPDSWEAFARWPDDRNPHSRQEGDAHRKLEGKKPTAEPHAMHGLILATAMDSVSTQADTSQASVTGVLPAGDFQGHWLSKTELVITASLKPSSFQFAVTAKNVGNEPLPMGIGWHPYFRFPSGDRSQARLRVAAKQRALVNDYDDVFPTGALVSVRGTPYDFSGPGGAPLGGRFLDDCFVDLERDTQVDILPALKGGDSYRRLRGLGGFLLHRSAFEHRFSTGYHGMSCR